MQSVIDFSRYLPVHLNAAPERSKNCNERFSFAQKSNYFNNEIQHSIEKWKKNAFVIDMLLQKIQRTSGSILCFILDLS